MKPETLARVQQHGNNLLRIFPNATEQDPINLCRKLRRLEAKAHLAAEEYCNGKLDSFGWIDASVKVVNKVRDLLGSDRAWANADPRGYALKVDLLPGERLHTDWGGYGIIAPDLN